MNHAARKLVLALKRAPSFFNTQSFASRPPSTGHFENGRIEDRGTAPSVEAQDSPTIGVR
jgi:hypothetical protein